MDELVIIRGGGDLATGVAQKFFRTGFNVLILETDSPTAIRRTVALCDAVYKGSAMVEDMLCRRIDNGSQMNESWANGEIPLIIDPMGEIINKLRPNAVIDAIMAKRNINTTREMAPITIALGPGFVAKADVDFVIETQRGHDLGRLIMEGSALPNTGVPGLVGGQSKKRVIHAEQSGIIKHRLNIGDITQAGEVLFYIDENAVKAPFSGLVRGLIANNMLVKKGTKVADIDPRTDVNVYTISDKARCIGGAVLEAFFHKRAANAKKGDA